MVKINKMKIKFNSWPVYSNNEIKIINKVVKSGKVNYWTGNYCSIFENYFRKKFNLNYTVSIANGSVALDAALSILNLKKNDEVLVTSRSYITTASSIQKTPAKIKFLDVNLNNQNICLNDLKKKINNKTKLIICVHLAGWPCDINKIKKIIGKRKILILEDCAQAHGAKINGKYVGSMGDISTWSFCNDKIMSTLGEGGMVACKNKNIYKKLWSYKDCGRNYNKIFNSKRNNNKLFKWIHDYDGTNLRMTEVQAAVGIEQLKNLEKMINLRERNLKHIYSRIQKSKIVYCPILPENIKHAGYRCYLFCKNFSIRNRFIEYLNRNGIDANQGSCPEIYKEKRFNLKNKIKLKNANKLGKISVSLPCHHLLSGRDLSNIVRAINKFINLN